MVTEKTDSKNPLTFFLLRNIPIINATTIWTLIGITEEGTETNKSAIAIANTAKTSQTNKSTKIRNIILARLLIVNEAISAMLRPFSLTLVTKAPKS